MWIQRIIVGVSCLLILGCGPLYSNSGSVQDRIAPNPSSTSHTGSQSWPSLSSAPNVQEAAGDVAVVVAIEDYVFLPDVPGARQTALEWEIFFEDGLGISNVYSLVDQNATREQITSTLAKARAQVSRGGKLWFVFVGHGAPDMSGQGLLVGVDAQQNFDSLSARGVLHSALMDEIKKSNASQNVVVLDACFSGRASSGALLAKGTQPVIPLRLASNTPPSTTVITAAQGDELAGSLPGRDRPAFSYLVLGALRGWSGGPDVTAAALVKYTERQLRNIPSRTQTPTLMGQGDVILVRGANEPDPGVSELMRAGGVVTTIARREHAGPVYDSGYGLVMKITPEWEHRALHAGELDSGTIARFTHLETGQGIVVQRTVTSAEYFEENLKTLHKGITNSAILRRQEGRTFGGQRGIWREYSGIDTAMYVVLWYVQVGDDFWIIGGPCLPSQKELYISDLEKLLQGASFRD